MSSVLLEFLFASFTAVCGLAVGWCWRGALSRRRNSAESSEPAATTATVKNTKADDQRLSREALARLQEMAVKMATDVDRHNTRVQEINSELSAGDVQTAEDVEAIVGKVLQANERMQEQLSLAKERLDEQARQIEAHMAEARTDVLTGTANRRAFDDQMRRCFDEHQRRNRPFCLMLLDIDVFKKINDKHGHQAGDYVLKCVANVLKQQVSKLEFVARYGGEEFAIIFPDSNLSVARPMAERARRAIAAATMSFDGKELRVTASAGIAELIPGEDVASLIKRTDDAAYESKHAGRNCAHWHDGTRSQLIKSPAGKPGAKGAASAGNSTPAKPSVDNLRDKLTGLPSRASYCEDVTRRVAERRRGGAPVSAMLIQIDRLADVAAQVGAGSADVVLRAVTQFLKATMREMDHVARYDEDVFSLLLPGAELDDATQIAERLRRAIERCRLKINDRECSFTVSIGLAEAGRSDSSEKLLELAGTALKSALDAGGNCSHIFTGRQFQAVEVEAVDAVPA